MIYLKCIPKADNKGMIDSPKQFNLGNDILNCILLQTGLFVHILHGKYFLIKSIFDQTDLEKWTQSHLVLNNKHMAIAFFIIIYKLGFWCNKIVFFVMQKLLFHSEITSAKIWTNFFKHLLWNFFFDNPRASMKWVSLEI